MAEVVYAWGQNADGELGSGNVTNSSFPVHVKGIGNAGLLTNIKAVSASRHSLALTSTGKIVAWGLNKQGQVGDGTNISPRTIPVEVKGVGGLGLLSNIKAISAGRLTFQLTSHSLAVGADGKVFAWGSNESGQLGDGTNTTSKTPVQVKGVSAVGLLSEILDVSGGRGNSLALGANGKVFAWGANDSGQLGDGTNTASKTPVQVKGVGGAGLLSNIKAISAGFHNLALRSDGVVFAWGLNVNGQLGDNTTNPTTTPIQVKGVNAAGVLSDIVAVSAGVAHSLALRSDGTVFAWGLNGDSQLGDGTQTTRKTPVQVKGVNGAGVLSGIVAVSAGDYGSCALRSDGEVFTWGDNKSGELGNGTTNPTSTPVQVVNVNGILGVSMGSNYALAI